MTGMLEFDQDPARRVQAAYTTTKIAEQRAGVIAALGLRPARRCSTSVWARGSWPPRLPR